MKHYRILIVALIASLASFAACDDPLNPEENFRMNKEQVLSRPQYAQGLLDYGYTQIPYRDFRLDEVGTDDAVTNNPSNSYLRIATGGWSALSDPQSMWTSCYRGIINMNDFLSVVEKVNWRNSIPSVQQLFVRRLSGEAYAVRGILKYYLIRNHGGKAADGTLLGVPDFGDVVTASLSDFSVPRQTFTESVKSAEADLKKAIDLLPVDYVDVAEVPSKYSDLSGLTANYYNLACGSDYRQRISGRIAQAFLSRLALLAASPAFNEAGTASLWESAANESAKVIADLGGLDNFDPKGHIFWLKEQVEDSDLGIGDKTDTKEMIWRRNMQTNNTQEGDNYPPTQYGKGRINPTQDFVNSFPMADGTPISLSSSYDPSHPYAGRDPRLAQIVVVDGSKVRSTVIHTVDGTTDDSRDKMQYSTRTGYYLRKLLREDVNMQTGKTTTQKHVIPMIRQTEILLNYAEAANEAWGPTGTASGVSYSAKDVIAAIRSRAGITSDAYLESITTKEDMRALIRNERRIELSFEGFRFWDIRRWKADLNVKATGVDKNYATVDVEDRQYESYMIYGPIPFNESLKFGYTQNQGW